MEGEVMMKKTYLMLTLQIRLSLLQYVFPLMCLLLCQGAEDILESTTIYVIPEPDAHVTMSGGGKYLGFSSDYNHHFLGFVARLNADVHVSCYLRGTHTSAALTRYGDDRHRQINPWNSSRYIFTVHGHWINVTIQRVQFADSSLYVCDEGHEEMKVLDAEKVPEIVNYYCTSSMLQTLQCKFYTNVKTCEMVTWKVMCTLEDISSDMTCDYQQSSSSSSENLVELNCIVDLPPIMMHRNITININGSGPFRSGILEINVYAGANLLKLSPVIVSDTNSTTKHSATLLVSLSRVSSPQQRLINSIVTTSHGLKYNLSVVQLDYLGRILLENEERTMVFESKSISESLTIEDLLPYTEYQFEVRVQINGTHNPDIWSEPSVLVVSTKSSSPERAPLQSPYGFEIITVSSLPCDITNGNVVSIYWEALPEKGGFSNGRIESYWIIEEASGEDTNTSKHNVIKQVDRDKTSAEFCITKNHGRVGVTAVTQVGAGDIIGWYDISTSNLLQDSHPLLRVCDIQSSYESSSDGSGNVSVTWRGLSGDYNYTVFWCERGTEKRPCHDKTMKWTEAGSDTSVSISWSGEKYRYGVSANTLKNPQTEGITWSECLGHVGGELVPARLNIDMNVLESDIRVVDPCPSYPSERAQLYEIHYCLYDQNKCSGKESVTTATPCVRRATVKLDKGFSRYAFWVESVAGDRRASSEITFITTERKALSEWQIVLLASGVTLLCVITGILSVVLYRWITRLNNKWNLRLEEQLEFDAVVEGPPGPQISADCRRLI